MLTILRALNGVMDSGARVECGSARREGATSAMAGRTLI
jgi:hypothetical protein